MQAKLVLLEHYIFNASNTCKIVIIFDFATYFIVIKGILWHRYTLFQKKLRTIV